MNYDDRICKKHKRYNHIELKCKNHPDLRWSTKNIDFIGARGIFFSSYQGGECACPGSDLYHDCGLTEDTTPF